MNFYGKIQDLQDQYSALNLERQLLEQKMKQREEFQRTFHAVRAQELQDELAHIEVQQIKGRARNQNLLQNIQRCVEQDQEGTARLLQMRQNLAQQKQDFVEQLDRRDPKWQELVRNQQQMEVERMERVRARIANAI